jgi:hypothetical protein
MSYVLRHGKRIEIETEPSPAAKKASPFKIQFVQVPMGWITALARTKRTCAWQLAMAILAEEFKRKHRGGEIVLSARVTQLPATTRIRAARELVRLGLIELEVGGRGRHAPLVWTIEITNGGDLK